VILKNTVAAAVDGLRRAVRRVLMETKTKKPGNARLFHRLAAQFNR